MNIIIKGEENYITPNNAAQYTIKKMLEVCQKDTGEDDITTFVLAANHSDNIVEFDSPLQKTLYFFEKYYKGKHHIFVNVQFEREDARKYYDEEVDVAILHKTIEDALDNSELNEIELSQSHDEPAFYHSEITFQLKVELTNSVEELIVKIETIENELFYKIYSIAAQQQIAAINKRVDDLLKRTSSSN